MKQVNLNGCQEHQIKQPYLAEDGERGVIIKHMESIRADGNSGDNHADDMRNFQSVQQQGCQQNDCKHNEEDEYGVAD